MTASIRSLLFRSVIIQQKIEAEQARPRPDWLRLMRLKRLRLLIAERIREGARRPLALRPALIQAGA